MGVAIIISDRADFRARQIIRNNDKGVILQEDLTIYRVYVPNNGASKYMRQKLIKLQGEGEIGEPTIIVVDFNTSVSEMDRSSWQKITEDIVELSSTISQHNWM